MEACRRCRRKESVNRYVQHVTVTVIGTEKMHIMDQIELYENVRTLDGLQVTWSGTKAHKLEMEA